MKRLLSIAVLAWLCSAQQAAAQETITVMWDRNPEPEIAGYTLYSGSSPGVYTVSQWVGNVTQRVMTIPPGRYYFVVRARNIYGMESPPSAEVSTTIATAPPPTPTWQALWQNTNNGQVVRWEVAANGAFISGGPIGLGQANPAWQIKASADFNGDGHKDLLFQHTQGAIVVWLLNGNSQSDSRLISTVSDTNWQIVSAADFNNDGHADILFHHQRTGALSVWIMNRMTLTRGQAVSPGSVPDTNWKVIGTADFNRDNRPDLLWQHIRTGTLAVWLMNGTTMTGPWAFTPQGVTDPQWRLKGATDVDEDGSVDLLWQHEGGGHIVVWYMSGRTLLRAAVMNPARVTTDWVLRGAR
jgi:hypothetical protein